jgi:hypothetical protein
MFINNTNPSSVENKNGQMDNYSSLSNAEYYIIVHIVIYLMYMYNTLTFLYEYRIL